MFGRGALIDFNGTASGGGGNRSTSLAVKEGANRRIRVSLSSSSRRVRRAQGTASDCAYKLDRRWLRRVGGVGEIEEWAWIGEREERGDWNAEEFFIARKRSAPSQRRLTSSCSERRPGEPSQLPAHASRARHYPYRPRFLASLPRRLCLDSRQHDAPTRRGRPGQSLSC